MTPDAATFYSYDYRSSGFALIASTILQIALLSFLGVWCGLVPAPPPSTTPAAYVILETRRPAEKPAPEAHSAISSSLSAAAAETARMQRYIDKYIQSLPEQPRPEPPSPALPRQPSPPPKPRVRKPPTRVIPRPVRQAAPLPVPLIEKPVKPLPEPNRNDAPLSDPLDTMRRRSSGKPAPAATPETYSRGGATSAPPGVSNPAQQDAGSGPTAPGWRSPAGPAPNNEIAAYLQLVRRRLEAGKTYPANARRRGLSGIVTLRFRIDDGGSVSDQTTAGTAPTELHAAALTLIRNRRFPAPPKGWNTAALLEVPIRYSLRESGFR